MVFWASHQFERKDSVLCDSGATSSITWDKNDLEGIQPYRKDILFSDHSRSTTTGIGIHKELKTPFLLAPTFKVKLFSPGQWLDEQKDANSKVILSKDGGYLISSGVIKKFLHRDGTLFVLDSSAQAHTSVISQTQDNFQRSTDPSVMIMHRRLGHIGSKPLRKLGFITSQLMCEVCDRAKHHRNRYLHRNCYAKTILEKLHLDINGPLDFGLNNERYFCVLVDEHSRMCFVGILKSKGEAQEWIKSTIMREQAKMCLKVSYLRSDNGSEVLSNDIKSFIDEQGITLELTPTYEPALNGIAERVQDTLLEKMRCLLLEANLPHSFWPFALLAAAERYSVTPHSSIGFKSPLEVYSGKDVFHSTFKRIRVFGSKVLVYPGTNHPLFPKTLSPRGEPGILLSCPGSTTVEVFLLDHLKVGIFRHFKLQEGQFYKKSELQSLTGDQDTSLDWEPTAESVVQEGKEDNMEQQNLPPTKSLPTITSSRQSKRKAARDADKKIRYQSHLEELLDESQFYTLCYNIELPKHINQALDDPQWKESTQKELDSLFDLGTFERVPVDEAKGKVVPLKWVYKVKTDSSGNVTKFKSRLVVMGNHQKFGRDFQETFAPVLNGASFRYVLDLAARTGMKLHSLDVSNAFVQSDVDKDVYVSQIPGYPMEPGFCYKLRKSLYGLKQAPLLWNKELDSYVKSLGFIKSSDPCLYYKREGDKLCIIAIYVDDIIVGAHENIEELKSLLGKRFKIEDNGPLSEYLGMKIQFVEKGIYVSQPGYIEKLQEKFGHKLSQCDSPMRRCFNPDPSLSTPFDDNELYRSVVGSLLYASTMTRPDISFAVGRLCRFVDKPMNSHMSAALRVLSYLVSTKDFGIAFDGSDHTSLRAYADSDWAACRLTRRSTSGFLIFNSGPIVWRSKLQTTVALSSSEAEIVSLSACAVEVCFVKKLYREIEGTGYDAVPIYEDNRGAVLISNNPGAYTNMKHVETRHFFCKDAVESGQIQVIQISTNEQNADGLTKVLDGEDYLRKRNMMGVVSPRDFC